MRNVSSVVSKLWRRKHYSGQVISKRSDLFHLLSQVTPFGEPLELRLCYREVFDSIVNARKFPRPIGVILKSCWGNQSSSPLRWQFSRKCQSRLSSANWKTYQRRSYSIFWLLSADLTPHER
ncbi:MAG: hypothetical protein ACTS7I_01980 [Candidatus Hodgkinia cicadicola]